MNGRVYETAGVAEFCKYISKRLKFENLWSIETGGQDIKTPSEDLVGYCYSLGYPALIYLLSRQLSEHSPVLTAVEEGRVHGVSVTFFKHLHNPCLPMVHVNLDAGVVERILFAAMMFLVVDLKPALVGAKDAYWLNCDLLAFGGGMTDLAYKLGLYAGEPPKDYSVPVDIQEERSYFNHYEMGFAAQLAGYDVCYDKESKKLCMCIQELDEDVESINWTKLYNMGLLAR